MTHEVFVKFIATDYGEDYQVSGNVIDDFFSYLNLYVFI